MRADWNSFIAEDARALTASEIRDLLKVAERPEVISFAGGVPDAALFPLSEFRAVYAELMADEAAGRSALQYSISEGLPDLRNWIAGDMAGDGAKRSIDNILITNGAQQGLDLLARLLLSPGIQLIVEKPSYLGAMQAFACRSPAYVGVGMDAEGPILAEMEAAFQGGARLAYLQPDFQNPTGLRYSLQRRRDVLALAQRYGALLIEDAAYCKLSYDGAALPSLLSLDGEGADSADAGTVIQLGTFSKTLVPAMRIGWVTAPRPLIDRMVLMMQASNLHVSTVNQAVALRAAKKAFPGHLETVRQVYRAKRDAMLSALTDFMPGDVAFTRPEGGMFVWLTLPEGFDARALLEQALEEEKVAFVPGQAFFCDKSGKNTCRLSFSAGSPERIRDGIERLANLIRRVHNQVGEAA